MPFFNTLNYSSCNEDGLAELRALEIRPGDDVCCITGSGDRPLHMLLGDPARVLAFDLNPVQNHLLALKMAAIRELDYAGFVQFLGLHPAATPRGQTYRALRPHLPRDAAAWFDARQRMIEAGVLYAGRWERYFRLSAFNLHLLRGAKIEQLMRFDDLAAQRRFVHERWNTWDWKLLLRLTFNRPVFRFALGDPGFYSQIAGAPPPWRYLHNRMTQFLENHLARSSFMMALVFEGHFFDPVHYPPYLQEQHFATLKARLPRIAVRTAPLFEVLESPDCGVCNKFSLSDVSSFLGRDDYRRLFACFSRKSGVRFCLRDFLTQRTALPADPTRPIRFLADLQEALAREDLSFGYTFIIGVTG